ncbi:tail protein X [Marinomonas transparens]|uniref:Tail protein X n=1 Tax=Marinomonas transparens TaxID=2795388 RepID=A0A934JIX6_9GAMM|nr:tail protein X [Marinomonas transparens]MBJ7536626.1 tail protein X [Marinomonas transparens]
MKTLRSREGDTISIILWMGLNRTDDEAEEVLFALNPGLEKYGPVLPAGITITLPEMPAKAPERVVNIWD